jgi:hypothetical protein
MALSSGAMMIVAAGAGLGAVIDKRNHVRGGIIGGIVAIPVLFYFALMTEGDMGGVASGVVSPPNQYLPEVERLV